MGAVVANADGGNLAGSEPATGGLLGSISQFPPSADVQFNPLNFSLGAALPSAPASPTMCV